MKKILLMAGLAISSLGVRAQGQPTAFWTEGFDNCVGTPCAANTYSGTNGAWSFTTGSNNGDAPNAFYASCLEAGYSPGACGSACGSGGPLPPNILFTGASMHISSTTLGDVGARYYAGSGISGLLDATTSVIAESPTINCTGKSNVNVAFTYIENGAGSSDNASIWYFDGSTWASLTDMPKTPCCGNQTCDGSTPGQWAAFSIPLPASANNNPNVKIGFRWENDNDGLGTDPSFAFDNVNLFESAPPSGNTITITNGPAGDICVGTDFQVSYTVTGTYNTGNIFLVVLSDANGDFTSGQAIGSLPAINNGVITATVPNFVLGGSGYLYRIVSSNPAVASGPISISLLDNPEPIVTPSGPTSFCDGGSVTLSSSFGDSFLWSNQETTQDITLSETTDDVFVKVTYPNGCTAESLPIDIIVNPNPDRPQILASGSLCTGGTITLTADQASGIVWNTSETSQSINVSTGGIYSVTYTDANGCSNTGDFEVIEFTSPSAPNLGGPYTQCGAVSLDAGSYANPVTYSWSSGESTQTIIANNSNIYTVTVTDGNGCSAQGSATVTVFELPDSTITNSSGGNTLCNGSSTTLSVPAQPGATYAWSNGGNTNSIQINSGGLYSVTVTGSNSCSSTSSINIQGVNCIPFTQLRVQDCGHLTFNLSSSIIADQVSGATQYEFQISDAADANILATVLNPTRTLALSAINPAIQWNTQYVVRVRAYIGTTAGVYGNACTIGTIPDPNNTVPATELRSIDCGSTSLTLTSFVQANVVNGATQYEFEFSQGGNVVTTKLQTSNQCNLGSLNPGLNWSNTYSVRVRAYIGSIQGTYGNPCNITIIADPNQSTIPATQLVAANCGRLNYNYTTGGCAAIQVPNATQYEFQFLVNNVVVGTRIAPTRICFFNLVVPALNPAQVYQCRVRAIISGVAGPFGAVCNIGFAPGTRFGTTAEDLELMPGEESLLNQGLEVTLMPNPFQGQTLVQLNSASENLQVRIFDLGGKLITEERINGANQYYLGTSLSKGVYILEITDSFGNVNRQRMIKTEE